MKRDVARRSSLNTFGLSRQKPKMIKPTTACVAISFLNDYTMVRSGTTRRYAFGLRVAIAPADARLSIIVR